MNNPSFRRTSGMERHIPFLCGLIVFKNFFNYYLFAFPLLDPVITALYSAITFGLLLSYIPLAYSALRNFSKDEKRLCAAAFIIPLCVLANTLYVMINNEGVNILSRQFYNPLAADTNYERGYYFAQINTWFCNMAIILLLFKNITRKETIIKCLCACFTVILVPTVVIMITHPELIGQRISDFEQEDLTFGGGVWNIGVIGCGSFLWLNMAMLGDATRRQRLFLILGCILFAFTGLAGISRTLIIMLSLSFSYYLLRTKKNVGYVGLIGLLFLFVGLFYLVAPGIVDSFLYRFTDDSSGAHNVRVLLWAVYLSHFKEYWLLGAPLGGVYNYYHDVNLMGANFLPHSSIINFCVHFGILASISYLLLIKNSFFSIGAQNSKQKRIRICATAGCIAYISLAFINQTGYTETSFYVMFGLFLALSKIYKQVF